MKTLEPLFTVVNSDDFYLVQPGDFDPDLDMQYEMASLERMCTAHLGKSFDQCSYADAATYQDEHPKAAEINSRWSWCVEGGGRKLEGFDSRYAYYLVETEAACFIFCRWEFDSVFVVSNLQEGS